MTCWALYDMRRAPLLKPVWKPVLNCQNLATWFSYIAIWWNQLEGSWRYDALQWNSCATRESSRAIILKSRYPMTYDSWRARMFFNLSLSLFNGISTFLDDLMHKPSLQKNSSGRIWLRAGGGDYREVDTFSVGISPK